MALTLEQKVRRRQRRIWDLRIGNALQVLPYLLLALVVLVGFNRQRQNPQPIGE